ncbi:hypothetical protein [Streptomyces triticirhizae]|nr:hypothetical protein [Streptomyces triticirhizae]
MRRFTKEETAPHRGRPTRARPPARAAAYGGVHSGVHGGVAYGGAA